VSPHRHRSLKYPPLRDEHCGFLQTQSAARRFYGPQDDTEALRPDASDQRSTRFGASLAGPRTAESTAASAFVF
jgi:hypothetical protein